MHTGEERDINIAERTEICRFVERYFVGSGTIVEKGDGWYGRIGKTSKSWVGCARYLEVKSGRRRIINNSNVHGVPTGIVESAVLLSVILPDAERENSSA